MENEEALKLSALIHSSCGYVTLFVGPRLVEMLACLLANAHTEHYRVSVQAYKLENNTSVNNCNSPVTKVHLCKRSEC